MIEMMKSKLIQFLSHIIYMKKRNFSSTQDLLQYFPSFISHPTKRSHMSPSVRKLQRSHFLNYTYNLVINWFLNSHISADSENSNCCKGNHLLVRGIISTGRVNEPFSHAFCKFFYIENNSCQSWDFNVFSLTLHQ